MKKIKIASSILGADLGKLNEEISEVDSHSDLLHIDVMDGVFVPNITFGQALISKIKSKIPLDCHLMIVEPMKHLPAILKCNPEIITFHIEAANNPIEEIKYIQKNGSKAGIAINPNTPLEKIEFLLNFIDMVLVMSVEPGYGGQEFNPIAIPKIVALRKLAPNLDIQVDGGINTDNIMHVVNAGANIIVVGSSVFKSNNRKNAINELRNVINK